MTLRDTKAFSVALPLIAAMLLIGSFLVGFHWRHVVYQVMCSGANDEHCTREWLSTFGTLAAAFIAAPALALGLGQIRSASRHHNELLQLQLQPKFALAQRIAELTHRIGNAKRLLWAYLNHDFDSTVADDAQRETAYRGSLREYDRIRNLIASIDFVDFEKEIGSGKPHTLGDLRERMAKSYAPSGPSAAGTALRLFMDNRVQVMNNAQAVNDYADACLRNATLYMSRWSHDP